MPVGNELHASCHFREGAESRMLFQLLGETCPASRSVSNAQEIHRCISTSCDVATGGASVRPGTGDVGRQPGDQEFVVRRRAGDIAMDEDVVALDEAPAGKKQPASI